MTNVISSLLVQRAVSFAVSCGESKKLSFMLVREIL